MKKFRQKGESSVTMDEIISLEEEYGFVLPSDYKEKMLNMNGVVSSKELFFLPDEWGDEIEFFYVLPIKYGTDTFEEANFKDELYDFPENHVIIGVTNTGSISMSLKESEYGCIYVFYSDGEMHKIADSYTEFLKGLMEEYF